MSAKTTTKASNRLIAFAIQSKPAQDSLAQPGRAARSSAEKTICNHRDAAGQCTYNILLCLEAHQGLSAIDSDADERVAPRVNMHMQEIAELAPARQLLPLLPGFGKLLRKSINFSDVTVQRYR